MKKSFKLTYNVEGDCHRTICNGNEIKSKTDIHIDIRESNFICIHIFIGAMAIAPYVWYNVVI